MMLTPEVVKRALDDLTGRAGLVMGNYLKAGQPADSPSLLMELRHARGLTSLLEEAYTWLDRLEMDDLTPSPEKDRLYRLVRDLADTLQVINRTLPAGSAS